MIEVLILAKDDMERVGKFRFEQLPRKGDEVAIAWEADQYGVRYFQVEEVRHFAEGFDDDEVNAGSRTVLSTREIE